MHVETSQYVRLMYYLKSEAFTFIYFT